jgi:hypothetical protein
MVVSSMWLCLDRVRSALLRENFPESIVRRSFFKPGQQRRILLGPLKRFVYGVGSVTGPSPICSGTKRGHHGKLCVMFPIPLALE